MRAHTLLLALTVPFAPAMAQDLTDHPGVVFEAVPGSFFEEGGPGAPAPGYDPVHDEYVMLFETPIEAADTACPAGRWALGMATSPNGIDWTPAPDPLFLPEPGTYYGCIAAQPALLIDSDTGDWHAWFKAHQESTTCDDPATPPPWGCLDAFTYTTGIGHAVSKDQGATWTLTDEPIVPFGLFGFPNATKVDGEFRLFFAAAEPSLPDYRMYSVTSQDGETWNTPKPVAEPGFAPLAQNQFNDISAQCRNDERPYINWVLGLEFGANRFDIAGAGLFTGTSANGMTWSWDPVPYLTYGPSTPQDRFVHHDAIRFEDEFGNENWAVYRTLIQDGKRVVKLAHTWPDPITALPTDQVQDRVCLSDPPTGDTATPSSCPQDGFEAPSTGGALPVTFQADAPYVTNGHVDGDGYTGKIDAFEVEVPGGCTLAATLEFAHEDPPVAGTSGDIDLAISVEDEPGYLALSDSTTNDESLEVTNDSSSPVTWRIEVLPFAAECTPYDLSLSLDCPEDTDPGPVDDTDDTGDTGDTGDTEDSGLPIDTGDTGEPPSGGGGDGGGCSCATGTSAPHPGLLGLFLAVPLALRRRRQA